MQCSSLLRLPGSLAVLLVLTLGAPAAEDPFKVEDVPSAASLGPVRLKPRTIAFSDHRNDDVSEGGLIRFEDWAHTRPVQKEFLSLYPSYVEPTINIVANGLTRRYQEKLHMFVAEARFVVGRSPDSIDLSRYATLQFLQTIDPSIKHRQITADEAIPNRDAEFAYNRRPDRRWCEEPKSLCIESRYEFEGKLPTGIRLANKLQDSGKKIDEYLEFQSELRVLSAQEAEAAGFGKLTGLETPIAGALEQSVFYVNHVMQAGKLIAVLQRHPDDAGKTIATVFMALAVETDVLEKKKEFERVPVLRNLVPAQVLMGNSSFNTGDSISAGLPTYARHRIRSIATLLENG